MSSSWQHELRALIKLSIPVVTVQVGMVSLGFVDSLMVGQISGEALASVGLGNFISFMVMMFGIGVLMCLDPLLSQGVGAKDMPSVQRNLQRGLLLAVGLSVPLALIYMCSGPALRLLRQPVEVAAVATDYVWILIPSILPFLLFMVFRLGLQSFSRVAPIVWTIILANACNVLLNWLWIYGHWGFPALGVLGSAWATLVCRWCMALGLLCLGWRTLGPLLRPWQRQCLDPAALLRMLRLGTPIGLQLILEFGAFGSTLLMMGWFGATQLAGHQVAIQLASLSFMVPLGIGFAAAVRVGYGIGRGDGAATRAAAASALALSTLIMLGFATLFLCWPGPLSRMFTADEAALAVAVVLVPVAGFFQVVDGLQAVAGGILRGMADTRGPMLINLVGFWIIGLPVGYLLGFPIGMRPEGLWWGLVVGLAVVSVLLLLRMRLRMQAEVQRTSVDEGPG